MDRFAKIMLFNEDMSKMLLEKGPQIVPVSIQLRDEDAKPQIIDFMKQFTGIEQVSQPLWQLIRREKYTAHNVEIWVVYGKLSNEELTNAHRKNSNSVLLSTASPGVALSPRLHYLIPMAIILEKLERDQWPLP